MALRLAARRTGVSLDGPALIAAVTSRNPKRNATAMAVPTSTSPESQYDIPVSMPWMLNPSMLETNMF